MESQRQPRTLAERVVTAATEPLDLDALAKAVERDPGSENFRANVTHLCNRGWLKLGRDGRYVATRQGRHEVKQRLAKPEQKPKPEQKRKTVARREPKGVKGKPRTSDGKRSPVVTRLDEEIKRQRGEVIA